MTAQSLTTTRRSGSPKEPAYYGARGLAFHTDGKYDQAIADFDQMIIALNANTASWSGRGGAYMSKGEFDLAIARHRLPPAAVDLQLAAVRAGLLLRAGEVREPRCTG
jgi:hypothetical protein